MPHLVVLVNSPAPLPPAAIQRLAELLATDAYSIRLALNRPRPVILGRPVEANAAEQAVAALAGYGCEAYALDHEEMKGLAEPLRARTLEFHRDHVRFVITDAELALSKWDNLFLLVHGRCRTRMRERETFTPRPGHMWRATPKITESPHESLTDKLDIYFFDGSPPVRIDCDRFSFEFLGTKRGLTDGESMQVTIQAIRKLAPQSILDDGFKQFHHAGGFAGRSRRAAEVNLGPAWIAVQTDVDDDAPRFDFYSRLSFLIHLKRAERAT
ncbi:MAG TPA: hypothetical protein PLC79_07130 [Phycisphaerae bacterium]|nr:hypothetical protein [Phycisphaerae bacterium]